MADTQAAGLGFLILRRWRGKHASPPDCQRIHTADKRKIRADEV